MGTPKLHAPVMLFYGVLYSAGAPVEAARERLVAAHGPIASESPVIDFDFTSYYDREMGGSIKRAFWAFEKLSDPRSLAAIKLDSNALEAELTPPGAGRPVNLDPGYLTLAKVVLASAKDNIHRIYIDNGIYLEITLYYKDGSYRPFQWTFPDYSSERVIGYFNGLRGVYKKALEKVQ